MFKKQLIQVADCFSHFIILETADSKTEDYIAGIGCEASLPSAASLNQVDDFILKYKGRFIFSHLCYDVKNEIEKLKSENQIVNNFTDIAFWVAEAVIICKGDNLTYLFSDKATPELRQLLQNLPAWNPQKAIENPLELVSLTEKEKYIKNCKKILQHIQLGDIYELNLCIAFTAKGVINPAIAYQNLIKITQAPMSCFYRNDSNYLLCASPERFIKKEGNILLSQPIKGTIRRGDLATGEDSKLKSELLNSEKERAENVMIVDLVRNDLSRIAHKATVKVDELCGIYSFKTVHQLISTVSCHLKPQTTFSEIIRATFPMGSMTGAPKIRAMELIEVYEDAKRGLFSGAVGYIAPNGDFDFNVVIRSIFYNESVGELNLWAGSAITVNSNPEKEYEECLLKLKAMKEVLTK